MYGSWNASPIACTPIRFGDIISTVYIVLLEHMLLDYRKVEMERYASSEGHR
jgi:hypothetical protein